MQKYVSEVIAELFAHFIAASVQQNSYKVIAYNFIYTHIKLKLLELMINSCLSTREFVHVNYEYGNLWIKILIREKQLYWKDLYEKEFEENIEKICEWKFLG